MQKQNKKDDTDTVDDAVKEIKSRGEGSGGASGHPRLIRFYRLSALEYGSLLWSWDAWRCSLVSIIEGWRSCNSLKQAIAIVVHCGQEEESIAG